MTVTKCLTPAICGPGLSAWMGSVCMCVRLSGLEEDRPAFPLQPSPPSETAQLQMDRPPALCFHLLSPTTSPSETISGFTEHFPKITFDFFFS